jgi:hypothetical protein
VISSFGPTLASDPALDISIEKERLYAEKKLTIFVVDFLEGDWLSALERFLYHPCLRKSGTERAWDVRETSPLQCEPHNISN